MGSYTFIRNMPGYLPDDGPVVLHGEDTAKRYAIDEMLRDADDYSERGEEGAAEDLTEEAEYLNLRNLASDGGWTFIVQPREGADVAYSLEPLDDDTMVADLVDDPSATGDEGREVVALDYLTGDDLGTPCGWGARASDCAPVAYFLARMLEDGTGDAMTLRSLDGAMSIAVNNPEGAALSLALHGTREDWADLDLFDRYDWTDVAAFILHAYDEATLVDWVRKAIG